MAGRGSPFVRNNSVGTTSETTLLEDFVLESEEQERVIFEEEDSESLYVVPFEEVDHFQRRM